MMKFKINNMSNLIFILYISLIILLSCKRGKETVGPGFVNASQNFQVTSDMFEFNFDNSDFQTAPASNWFNAAFNERVSWEIKISGTETKAYKIISGVSDELNQTNSIWYGTHTNPYFFKQGEIVIAELSILGSDKKWVDSSVIVKEIKDYGPDVLLWWDLTSFPAGNGVQGIPNWYAIQDWDDEHIASFSIGNYRLIDPIQRRYRSIEAKDKQPSNGWMVEFGSDDLPLANATGFPGASLDEVYLNFYIRPRTSTNPSIKSSIKCHSGRKIVKSYLSPFPPFTTINDYEDVWTHLYFTVPFPESQSGAPNGNVIADSLEWRLVSIKLSDMTPEHDKPPFDPGKIVSVFKKGWLEPNAVSTGFDMDFIVLTKGVPFNKIK